MTHVLDYLNHSDPCGAFSDLATRKLNHYCLQSIKIVKIKISLFIKSFKILQISVKIKI